MPATRSAQPGPGAEGNANEDARAPTGPAAKRRKTRKGTNSCWACKRRKEKCIFDRSQSETGAQATVCLACQRRGTPCVSQEFPDDSTEPPARTVQVADSAIWIEALVEQLVKRFASNQSSTGPTGSNSENIAARDCGIPTPATVDLESGQNPPSSSILKSPASAGITDASTPLSGHQEQPSAAVGTYTRDSRSLRLRISDHVSPGSAKLARLSRALYNALPSIQDSDILCRTGYRSSQMFTEILTIPYKSLGQSGLGSRVNNLVRPGPQTHPVLLARHMLQLMHILQQFHPSYEALQALSEPPDQILERLTETAITQVSTQDRFLGNIEGLECVLLESMYHANGGSLRLSWAANRRALHLAQLMGFHQDGGRLRYHMLDPTSKADPRSMWFHIIQYDCSLSLLLGLPRGFQDCNVATEALLTGDIALGRLERIHCAIVTQILDRNSSKRPDFSTTQQLDRELQKEARRLPSRWWLPPRLSNKGKDDESLFWDLKRLIVQISHYNILNRLHLPYMLRASKDPSYQYSQIACVNASREILSRTLVLHEFNRVAFCCRTPDFMALMAAMTLVLAHLDSHRHASSLLVHQYLSDRAMMEQMQQSMEEYSRINGDALSTESADLLRRLLAIEAEVADGHTANTERVTVQPQGEGAPDHNESDEGDGVVHVHIPYFGIVKIAREGTISKETLGSARKPVEAQCVQGQHPEVSDSRNSTDSRQAIAETLLHSPQFVSAGQTTDSNDMCSRPDLSALAQSQSLSHVMAITEETDPSSAYSQPQDSFYDPYMPGFTAGIDDWTFQGVDLAFFETLASGDVNSEFYHMNELAWQSDGG
ncbi:hypothetical protein PFICI_14968 [Pestalotiopsis fici W106-1]|uniref:Zn(2)-C6 fungal-type domain-containing protein n=1 Tax=Pestalotiopsis fici (strain W106-1 / CGMCC3.15140) TaxID=1229662 RepID=W3WHJ1_PESFW|nr:uncharacterized protein PFICI_14968 [Pestalotiopsis fici W106-1]ETS73363.1 hypothetical protein PFICI_14968 [Pestalotiopsis fici W106-1]